MTIVDWRTWFQGHNSCSPTYKYRTLKGITFRDFDHTSFGLLAHYESWVHKMANKKSSAQSNWSTIEFINQSLSEPQRKDFKSWYATEGERVPDLIGQAMVDDYRLSCSWDDNNQCFIATLTGKQDQRFNASKALSARSDDWLEAMALALYKHLVIFKGGQWSGETTRNNWG